MAKEFKLSVVAPDRTVFEDVVQSVIAPGVQGYLGVWAGHEPSIVALRAGIVEYRDHDNQRYHVAIGGGFMEVSGDSAIILAEKARMATEIDIREEEARLERARAALRSEPSDMTTEEATEEIDLAVQRIKAAKRV